MFSFANNFELKNNPEARNLMDLSSDDDSDDEEARKSKRKSRVTFKFPTETRILSVDDSIPDKAPKKKQKTKFIDD